MRRSSAGRSQVRSGAGQGRARGALVRLAGLLACAALLEGMGLVGLVATRVASAADTTPGAGAGSETIVRDSALPPIDVPGGVRVPNSGSPGGGEPGLEDLLRLPSGFEAKSEGPPVAGASQDEWRRRFSRAEKAIADARGALAATKQELDGLAETGGANQWSVAPPGGTSGQQTTSPLSFKLRQQLAKNREALDEAEKALRELRIEADLAGVPPGWRIAAGGASAPSTPTGSPAP